MITSAALCPAPPLLARELTGTDPVAPELRQACLDATAALVANGPDLAVVVGAAAGSRVWPSDGRLDLGAYGPGLARLSGQPPVPLPLGLGTRLLDEVGYAGRRQLQSVSELEPATACAALGAQLASSAERVALLVMADGSARRGLKAPGYLDERSAPFDATVETAVRTGELATLLALDAEVARDLMATGRPGWQVLAGAMNGHRPATEIRYCDDPFGVAYLVASLQPGR